MGVTAGAGEGIFCKNSPFRYRNGCAIIDLYAETGAGASPRRTDRQDADPPHRRVGKGRRVLYNLPAIVVANGLGAALTLLLVVGLVYLINHTRMGMAMRAAAKDFETAQLMGIKINAVISVTFVIGSFLAAVGALLYFTNYPSVGITSGAMPGLKAFVAAVFGGIGSIPGAVVGAFIIGLCEELIKGLGYTTFSDAFTFALLIVVLCVRPTGLFGEKVTDKV